MGRRSYDIRGKFCYINFDFKKVNSEMIEKIMTLKNQTLVKFIEFNFKPFTLSHIISTLKSGPKLFIDVCIPNSCSKNDLQNIIKWVTGNEDLLTVEECQERDDKRIYSIPQIITMSIFAFFIIWVTLATVAEKLRKLTNHPRFIDEAKLLNNFLSVSLSTSLQKLISVNINRETKWICAAKFFIMNVLVFGHIIITVVYVPSVEYLRNTYDMWHNIVLETIMNGIVPVESFFFISAFLTTYLRKNNIKRSKFYYIFFLVKRYVRLTFPVLCVVAIAVILPNLVDGPHWHTLVNICVKDVELKWWKIILHVFNFENIGITMISHVWIMNVIFQYNIITVPVLFVLDRWPKIGIMLMIILSLVGFSTSAVFILTHNYTFAHGYSTNVQAFTNLFNNLYIKPYSYHLSSYFMGLLTGFILSERKVMNFGKVTRFTFWVCSIVLMLLSVYGLHGYMTDLSPDRNIIVFFTILAPYAWIIGQIWMCIAFTKGYGGGIRNFLSMDIFVILDRLNTFIYTLHPFILIYLIVCFRKPLHHSMVTMWMLYVFVMFLSIIFSFLFYVFLQAPFNFMFKNLFFKSNSNENENEKNERQLQTMGRDHTIREC
ncbi:O-acyltransferase like protein-like [Centruroides sculpturatus]|uniref:O-acyltransferase like protein-like n=1 Tax=Centruroides sculpturatus TaxID=218467 RepID=UPI000C6EFAD6|nr:O-acyltransferase like protein-like [Centruroides sculpturatus]